MEKKYYMNNICEIIREITPDFSEIKVYPEFRVDLEGRDWCTECQVGNQGTPTRHTCEEYQEVINALEDVENAIICIVENRLLTSEPIEFKKLKILEKEILLREDLIIDIDSKILDKSKVVTELDKLIKDKNYIAVDIDSSIQKANKLLVEVQLELDKRYTQLKDLNTKYILNNNPESNISEESYKYLQKRDFILTKLEQGGVENWEWYGESYPTDKELEEFN